MRFGSLFSGIGGMDLGLERAGMQCAWQVEIDEFCRKVLTKHWPNVPKFNDVRECGKHNLERVDLIAGGFPCQDISNAGKRAGIQGPRSGLWSEFHRIIGELRPRYVLVENVAALLNRGLERVLGDLAESGYDAQWDCLPAAAFGAPHRRDRVWLVAYAPSMGRPHADANFEEEPDNKVPERDTRLGFVDAASVDFYSRVFTGEVRQVSGAWSAEPDVGRVAHGIPARMDRLRGLGNAVVPQVAEWIGKRIIMSLQSET